MKKSLSYLSYILPLILIFALLGASLVPDQPPVNLFQSWPEPEATMKPWTRWWWHGNAVDRQNITKRLEEFSQAGIGGVEITPIYGVKGYENRFLKHLSPEWTDMLLHTLNEAERLGMGVDMVPGTGWPYGGPQVDEEFAAVRLSLQTYTAKANKTFREKIVLKKLLQKKPANLQYLYAFDSESKKTDLLPLLKGETLIWTPERDYVIYAVFFEKTGQQVKRPAPGGEGYVMNHFSKEALENYLKPYEHSLMPARNRLRAIFNDSYEVYGADYTPRFFEEFHKRRGYDFTDYLPLLSNDSSGTDALRILSDYRETLSDLVLEDMSENWTKWAHKNHFLTKYQAHGCPGNLLDIYASADIPECESFYATDFNIPGLRRDETDANPADTDFVMLKFASSAAHISGKHLTSSESLTWLREHFKTALSHCKPEIEQIFLAGVNHVFLHGSSYYPDDAPWPGWKFYAEVNFVPTSAIWNDIPFMFDYITRCQSMLQSGLNDNDILVYWPFHDVIGSDQQGRLLLQLGIHNKDQWLANTSFYELVRTLIDQGYSVDFISDRFLEKTAITDGRIKTPGLDYKALIIPDCNHMPLATWNTLERLIEAGGKVLFEDFPESVPGFYNHAEETHQLQMRITEAEDKLLSGRKIVSKLEDLGIRGEDMKQQGLDFIRRRVDDGLIYFLVNHTPNKIDQYITLGCKAETVVIMDPLTAKTGYGRIKRKKKKTDVYLQMDPGQTIFLRTYEKEIYTGKWEYFEEDGNAHEMDGTWNIEFLSGGPSIPAKAQMQELKSWTILSPAAEAFSGTARYTTTFRNPDPTVSDWILDLGDVRESARIKLNDKDAGCLWSVPFKTIISGLNEGENTLEIEVTNLSANRIRDLELRGIEWKNFYDINMVDRHYEKFDATKWLPMPSGLLGKVTLTPLKNKIP